MVVYGNGENFLSLLLTNDIFVKISLYLLGLHQFVRLGQIAVVLRFKAVFAQCTAADITAFHQHIIGGYNALAAYHGGLAVDAVKHTAYHSLMFSAKGANHRHYIPPLTSLYRRGC